MMRIMNLKHSLRRMALPLLGAALALGIAACENPVQDGEDAHPTGVVVFSGSTQVAAYDYESNSATGELVARKGETRTFRVRIVMEGGRQRDIDGVEFSITDPQMLVPNLATVSLLGPDQLRITGQQVTPQQTTVTFEVSHGEHPEFTAELRVRIAE